MRRRGTQGHTGSRSPRICAVCPVRWWRCHQPGEEPVACRWSKSTGTCNRVWIWVVRETSADLIQWRILVMSYLTAPQLLYSHSSTFKPLDTVWILQLNVEGLSAAKCRVIHALGSQWHWEMRNIRLLTPNPVLIFCLGYFDLIKLLHYYTFPAPFNVYAPFFFGLWLDRPSGTLTWDV